MSYIVQRKDRFYVVAYDGLDPLTGRERRRWHPVGHDARKPNNSPPDSAVVYTDDAERPRHSGPSAPSKTGANVVLAQPYDPIVFERGKETNGVRSVSIPQGAIDCLTGPGRMPGCG